MLDASIMRKLSAITREESEILKGKKIDRSIYTDGVGSRFNGKKLLEMGKVITVRTHTRFIDFPAHTHDYVEVVYMCQGSTVHFVNGTKIVLNEGELLFLSRSAVHEIREAKLDDIAVNFIILPEFFERGLRMLGDEETPLKTFIVDNLSGREQGSGYLHFKVADVIPIQNLVENLIYTLIADIPNKRNVNQITMGLLFLQLVNCTDRLAVQDKKNTLMLEVLKYIDSNYQSGSLTELAALLHYDLHWLSREIKRFSGKSYTALLQEKRLSQARFLLAATSMSVSAISHAIGYENVSYFHRIFAKQAGLSPRSFRVKQAALKEGLCK